ncbi:MAG: folate-binding protein [Gallionellaceae bacterium]|nr:folate-binding protein [Gallionellaceae bacterium]
MNPDWQLFLQQHRAHIQDGIVQHFGNSHDELLATQNSSILCALSQFATLKVSGEDAKNFLQNLLSSDLQEVTPHRAQLSSLNTPKGRMLASFLIWSTGTEYFLHLPYSLANPMLKRLSMYILRAKVKIEDFSAQQICLGISGSNAAMQVQQHLGSAPQEMWGVAQHETASVICIGPQRFQINTTMQHAPDLWQKLSANTIAAGSVCWDSLNIRAGIPVILPATQEQFVPQMANLELIGGVSFKKGCYPGQEIVARMQYLGKLKRRMYLAHIATDTPPQAGDELYNPDMADQASGMVVNAAPAPQGGYDLLAVIQISSRETQAIHWKSLQGATLQFLPLPYGQL